MADDGDQDIGTYIVSDQETRWKGKYFTLLKYCREIEQVVNPSALCNNNVLTFFLLLKTSFLSNFFICSAHILKKACENCCLFFQENERLVNRIYHVKTLLKRYRKQRR